MANHPPPSCVKPIIHGFSRSRAGLQENWDGLRASQPEKLQQLLLLLEDLFRSPAEVCLSTHDEAS